MKIPKRLKEPSNDPEKGVDTPAKFAAPPGKICRTTPAKFAGHKRRETKEGEREVTVIADAMTVGSGVREETREEIEQSIAKVTAVSRAKRDAKKRHGYSVRGEDGGIVPTVEAMRRIWADLHREHLPQIPVSALPDKAVHMLRSYAREWNRRNPGKEWVDYLGWVFANWPAICRTSLHWMTSKPDAPGPQLIASAKLRVYLEDGWQHRAKMDAIYALPPREREIRFLMLERGIGRGAAEALVRSNAEAVDAMAQVREERAKLEAARQRLEQEISAETKGRIRRKKEDAFHSRVRQGLDSLSGEEEDSVIASIHAGRSRRRLDATTKPRKPPAVVDDVPASFPAWDEVL